MIKQSPYELILNHIELCNKFLELIQLDNPNIRIFDVISVSNHPNSSERFKMYNVIVSTESLTPNYKIIRTYGYPRAVLRAYVDSLPNFKTRKQ
jgi:hypothetical protein